MVEHKWETPIREKEREKTEDEMVNPLDGDVIHTGIECNASRFSERSSVEYTRLDGTEDVTYKQLCYRDEP